MRIVTVLSAVLLASALCVAQAPDRGVAGHCFYGCGPYVPLITTPSVSFTTVSPNPVGATNATAGLIAGATNSTLSELPGNQAASYTVPVWYSGGGTPIVESAVNAPDHGMEHMHPEMHEMHGEMHHGREGEREKWTFFSGVVGSESVAPAATAGRRKATRTFTNQDVERQNEKNGTVHYDGKTEKI